MSEETLYGRAGCWCSAFSEPYTHLIAASISEKYGFQTKSTTHVSLAFTFNKDFLTRRSGSGSRWHASPPCPQSDRISLVVSVGTLLCPYGTFCRRAYGLSTRGLFKQCAVWRWSSTVHLLIFSPGCVRDSVSESSTPSHKPSK